MVSIFVLTVNTISLQKGTIMLIKFLFHTFMTLITGGLWLIGLVIWVLVKKA